MDGFLLPEHAGDRSHSDGIRLHVRGHSLPLFGAFSLDHLRHGSDGDEPRRDVGRRGWVLLRFAQSAQWGGDATESSVYGGAASSLRIDGTRSEWRSIAASATPGTGAVVQEASPRPAGAYHWRGGIQRLRQPPPDVCLQPREN